MSTFAGSRLTADDVMAFHTRYHDAMHGTLAPGDQHHHQYNLHYGTLPRPLRSYHAHRSGEVSTLSGAAQPTSAASAFRTPQWSEFSECVREVSPRTADEEEDDVDDLVASRQEKNDDEASMRVARRVGASPTKSTSAAAAAGRDVVDRLAALSQSPHADAMAVAAALREAEEMLSQGKTVAAVPVETYQGEAPLRRNDRSQHRRLPFADRDVLHEKAAASHQAPYSEQLRKEAAEEHHRRWPETHSSFQAPPPPPQTPPAWPWPTSAAERSSFTPALSPQWPTAAASTASPQLTGFAPPAMNSAGVLDATAHWYEVYYAWMLYYQQLYAAQVQQYEQAQRREARRARSQHRHRHRHGRQQQDGHVSRGTSRTRAADTEGSYPHHDNVSNLGERHGAMSASREHEGSRDRDMEARHRADQRDHSRRMGKRDTMTAGDGVGGSVPDDRVAETQQLRAELRQLEQKLAALSATAVATDEETSHYQSRSQRSPPPRSGAGKARAGANRGRRVRPASASPSPERVASHSVVVRPPPTKPAAAAVTWQALSERQRSRSATGGERQRPQWR